MYSIYVIQSLVDKRLYVGMSHQVDHRLGEHNAGRVFSTKGYRPWKLVYKEIVGDRVLARAREKFLKGGSGKEWIKTIIAIQE